jgi:hypothetical protein
MATVVSLGGVSGTSGATSGADANVLAAALPAFVELLDTDLDFLVMMCPLRLIWVFWGKAAP